MILAVCRFAAQKHADYRTSVFRLFSHSFLYKSKQGRLVLTVLLFTKSSFPLPLCFSRALFLVLVQALFPLQYFFPAPLYLWKRHFKSLPVWISLVFFLVCFSLSIIPNPDSLYFHPSLSVNQRRLWTENHSDQLQLPQSERLSSVSGFCFCQDCPLLFEFWTLIQPNATASP